ncbi:unnamed protein product [Parajaminaea phylloscopi]
MSQSTGATPNLQLSPQERLAFAHYFSLADPTNSGLVHGHAAVPFFAKSKLSPPLLGQIWTLADSANNGFLTAPSFSVALRLIGHAQRGETPDERLVQRPGPPPVLEGIQLPQLPPTATPLSPQRTGNPASAGQVEIRPEDRARYTRIFASAGPAGGLLDGEKAKEIFVKSKLPFDKLGAIWNLADTKARGALDLTDFIIGMYFIQASMTGSLQSVPATLPPGLYEAASNSNAGQGVAPNSPMRAQATGGSSTGISQPWGATPLSPHVTGARGGSGFASPVAPPAAPSFLAAQRTGLAPPAPIGVQWGVTPDEKAKADQFFDGLDTERKGELAGATVVPFFMQSKLSEAVLANVWDLSDITQSGSLTRDEFAVAMHLINATLTGAPVPQELPANLVPPSLRGQKLPEAVDPQQTDTQKDLFSLMDDDDVGQAALPVSTATAFAAPVPGAPVLSNSTGQERSAPSTAAAGANSGPFDDDFFGSSNAGSVASPPPSVIRGGAPGGTQTQLPSDQSADYGNKSLQLDSTQKAVNDLQSKRNTLESGVAAGASSLAELESRLATVKSMHETESRLVKELEGRRDKQALELKTLREELISEESELSRLKAEKDEIEQQVMRDREEVRSAKKRMSEVQTEVNALKSEVEKLRKEGRQQKGMVAIAKKQLSTAEGEHSRLSEEKSALEAPDHVQDGEAPSVSEPSRGLLVPGSSEPVAASPAASTRSLNPFDRFNAAGAPAESSAAPDHGSHVAAGAVAGATAATAGLGALSLASKHHEHEEERADPFGAGSGQTDGAAAAQDPWASNQPSAPVPADSHPTASFDEAFGDDFAPSQPQSSQAAAGSGLSAFDDAFGGEDTPPAAAREVAVTAPGQDPVPVHATTTDGEPSTGEADLPVVDSAALDKGKAPIRGTDTPQEQDNDDDDDSSSDEDEEGPEDLEGYQHADAITPARPDDSARVAETPAEAVERFPELSDADADADADVGTALAGSGGDAQLDQLAPPTDLVSSQNTGPSEAFVDATSGDTAMTNSAHLPSSSTAEQSRAADPPSGFDAFSAPGAFDDDFGAPAPLTAAATADLPSIATNDLSGPTASTKSLAGSEAEAQQSATSSIKTRRAPPPAPVKSNASVSSAGVSGAGAGALPGPGPSQQATFDDFEASFADLEPTQATRGATSTAHAANPASASGFEDGFDDADFDFVPSFDGENIVNAAADSGRRDDGFGGGDDAFAHFDDAFGEQPAGHAQPASAGAPAAASATNSGPNSGFSSFEDAFAPSNDGHAAGTESTSMPPAAAPPVLPARGGARGTSTDTESPALPDDAAPVRQLAGMGFARHKVIAALEKSNYRVEKALERLLSEA